MPQFSILALITASALAGVLSASVLVTTLSTAPAAMVLTPDRAALELGDTITETVQVRATTPVNVFRGVVRFDETKLRVDRIDYNTSIANLWAEEPWYAKGEGTISFTGGTTQPSGFTGDGDLMTITFVSIAPGEARIALEEVAILQHDGLGTLAAVAEPIDALFTVAPETPVPQTVAEPAPTNKSIVVLEPGMTTDLNGDGQQTIADISIFFRHLATQNLRSDFNGDRIVSTGDLSILLGQPRQ